MTAYSFKRRFVEPIRAGDKTQTIRADRKRHARPGERLQLFHGMRTKHCFKILEPDPVCESIWPIRIRFNPSIFDDWVQVGDWHEPGAALIENPRNVAERDAFAKRDGFDDWGAMRAFWQENHPEIGALFTGMLIRWSTP